MCGTCHMSHVTGYVSHFILSYFLLVELVGEVSVINGATLSTPSSSLTTVMWDSTAELLRQLANLPKQKHLCNVRWKSKMGSILAK